MTRLQKVSLGIVLVGATIFPILTSQAQFYGQNWYDFPDTTIYPGDPSPSDGGYSGTGTQSWRWLSDRELKKAVENQLFWSPFVDADDIKVSVKDGKVTLRGTVEDQSTAEGAIENAYEAGARDVVSKLKTAEEQRAHEQRSHRKNQRTKTDQQLKEDVKNRLARHPNVNPVDNGAWRVGVTVQNGVVTLRGTLDDQHAVNDAIQAAYEAGAKDVVSKLDAAEESGDEGFITKDF
ncbi:MAG: hypothetical protein A4E19_20010 [Nitrospira sp. SG-bin1]|nr:MAG: hypothetical protein A4E19_20010 [Nitrospira sp. SG-bin1]